MSTEATYRDHGLRYMVFDLFGEKHVIGEGEIDSIGTTPGISFGEYAAQPPMEPKGMIKEVELDMMRRPDPIEPGARPAEYGKAVVRGYILNDDEKKFVDDHMWGYPIAIMALAMGINARAVTSYISHRGGALKKRSEGAFGEPEAMQLRRKYIGKLINKYSYEE